MSKPPEDPPLTVGEVMELLGIHDARAIRKLIKSGKLKSYQVSSSPRGTRIRTSQVNAFIEEQERGVNDRN